MTKGSTHPLFIIVPLFIALELALIGFLDRPLSDYMRQLDGTRQDVINVFRDYTDLGKSKWYLWPSALGAILCAILVRIERFQLNLREVFQHVGRSLFFSFIAIALSGLVTDFIKPIVGRARPVELTREGLYGFRPLSFDATWNSFPSGHATTAFTLTALLILFFPRQRILWIIFGILIGLSRVMVNTHYLSDVLAGAAIGLITVYLLRRERAQKFFQKLSLTLFPIK